MADTQMTTPTKGGDFAALFEASSATTGAVEMGGEGQIVTGVIVQVSHDSVVVDIGGKSEGVISMSEFTDASGQRHRQGGRHASTSSSRAARTTTAWSSFPRRRPTR